MPGLALVLTGLAALGAVLAYLILTAPPVPPEPVGQPTAPPRPEPRNRMVYCACCGERVWVSDAAEVISHIRSHAETPEVAADLALWEQEVGHGRRS